jgi:hypothetical protein
MTEPSSNDRNTGYDDADPAAGEYFPAKGDLVRFPLAPLPENRGRVYEVKYASDALYGSEGEMHVGFQLAPPDRPCQFGYSKSLDELRRIGMEKVPPEPPRNSGEVRSGQVWADLTPDLVGRTVKILRTNETHAFFEVLTPSNSAWSPEKAVGRRTSCTLRRFRENKTGFRLIQDVPGD